MTKCLKCKYVYISIQLVFFLLNDGFYKSLIDSTSELNDCACVSIFVFCVLLAERTKFCHNECVCSKFQFDCFCRWDFKSLCQRHNFLSCLSVFLSTSKRLRGGDLFFCVCSLLNPLLKLKSHLLLQSFLFTAE